MYKTHDTKGAGAGLFFLESLPDVLSSAAGGARLLYAAPQTLAVHHAASDITSRVRGLMLAVWCRDGSIREMCRFFSKTCVKRTQPGQRQTVQNEGESR
jgi:hypothetical protein